MADFLIKMLGHQEMGSPDENGNTKRGKYFYFPKRLMGTFFPLLSTGILNDSVLLPIIPPFDNIKVYSRFEYHNDKFFPRPVNNVSPNDECRLYLNREVEPDKKYFQPGDVVVFEKINRKDESVPVYLIHKYSKASKPAAYAILTEIINLKGNYVLTDESPVPGEEHSAERYEESEVVLSIDIIARIAELERQILELKQAGRTEEAEEKAETLNSTVFRDTVLAVYGKKCAVTGEIISWNQFNNLEAAHIKPRAHGGTFSPRNGIALSRDMHWAFDKGLFTISSDFRVVVHPELKNTSLQNYHDKEIIIPAEPEFRPFLESLDHHRKEIFGLFLKQGVIRKIAE